MHPCLDGCEVPRTAWAVRSQGVFSDPQRLSAPGMGPGCVFGLNVTMLYLDLTGGSAVQALEFLSVPIPDKRIELSMEIGAVVFLFWG